MLIRHMSVIQINKHDEAHDQCHLICNLNSDHREVLLELEKLQKKR